MSKQINEIIDYYHTKESRWGYKLVLGGTIHFGYYPDAKNNISMRAAMVNMIDKLGKAINLPPDSLVLDAGCGEGTTAIRLAKKLKYKIEGIDLLDFNIASAKKRLTNSNLGGRVNFRVGNYMKLDFPDNTFDAIYTMETLVHAPDYNVALKEFHRVLKKNGKLVLFEYSMPGQEDLTDKEKYIFETISKGSAMHSLISFTHGSFPKILQDADFKNVKVEDITKHMLPMVKRFYQMGIIPYQIVKLVGKQQHYVNTTSGVEIWKNRKNFRYNIITAEASQLKV